MIRELALVDVYFLLLAVLFSLRVYTVSWVNSRLTILGSQYVPLQHMVVINDCERFLSGIIGFNLYIKMFKYFRHINRFQFLFDLLKRAFIDLIFFLIIFFVFIIGMAQMGFLFF
jgi:hypothetical protein